MADKKSNIKCYASIAIIGVIVFWALLRFVFCLDITDIGVLFSGLAFAGIIITALLQKEELGLQRAELELQREEIKKTRGEFKQQNATMKLQRFENTFFNLLNLLQKVVDSIDYNRKIRRFAKSVWDDDKTITIVGRDVFQHRYNSLIEDLSKRKDIGVINKIYNWHYNSIKTDFEYYFRVVYQIIKLVDETDFESDNSFEIQYKYVSILRVQLSDYEMLWLFYHCLSEYGREKFKPLVEKYSFFEDMLIDKIHNQSLLGQYDRNAFGKKE